MTLHPEVLAELISEEALVARDRLAGRAHTVEAVDGFVYCMFEIPSGRYRLRLDCRDYDAEPPRLAVVDDDDHPLPGDRWPPGLLYSSVPLHPVLDAPWACVRGTFEYHCYPGHTGGDDAWDIHRTDLRIPDLLSHLLQRCGR